MTVIYYDVPLIEQGNQEICLPACMAMLAAYYGTTSPDLNKYVSAFVPGSNVHKSSIDIGNTTDMRNAIKVMARFGFAACTIDGTPKAIADFMRTYGPFILVHHCYGFNYGREYPHEDDGSHAVVVTSTDPESVYCTINNPWGDKDRMIAVSNVINAIYDFKNIAPNIVYYPARSGR